MQVFKNPMNSQVFPHYQQWEPKALIPIRHKLHLDVQIFEKEIEEESNISQSVFNSQVILFKRPHSFIEREWAYTSKCFSAVNLMTYMI